MHVHPRTSLESPVAAVPLPVTSKKSAGTGAQNAGGAATAQPTVTGLYAQTLKRKSATSSDDDSGTGYSNPLNSEGESVSGVEQSDATTADTSTGFNPAALQTYTARGVLSGPPSTPGEIFETTV
jgi:hypothetical protein